MANSKMFPPNNCHVKHDTAHYSSWIFNIMFNQRILVVFPQMLHSVTYIHIATCMMFFTWPRHLISYYRSTQMKTFQRYSFTCMHTLSTLYVLGWKLNTFPSSPLRFLLQNPICNWSELKKGNGFRTAIVVSQESWLNLHSTFPFTSHFSTVRCHTTESMKQFITWSTTFALEFAVEETIVENFQKLFSSFMEHTTSEYKVSPFLLLLSIPNGDFNA